LRLACAPPVPDARFLMAVAEHVNISIERRMMVQAGDVGSVASAAL
jgi:hypothetical protein